jgi:hypothetical protein
MIESIYMDDGGSDGPRQHATISNSGGVIRFQWVPRPRGVGTVVWYLNEHLGRTHDFYVFSEARSGLTYAVFEIPCGHGGNFRLIRAGWDCEDTLAGDAIVVGDIEVLERESWSVILPNRRATCT